MTRTFIAIEIPPNIKKTLGTLQSKLRSVGPDASWTKTDNIHLTLKFLGELNDKKIALVCSATKKACETMQPFEMEIAEIGVFPNPKRPRVIWVGLAGKKNTVMALQQRLDSELSAVDFPPDDHEFSPHLTLGRIKSHKRIRELRQLSNDIEVPQQSFLVDHVTVMQSQLHQAGSIYTPIEICRFHK